jgi:hypothetical protein
MADEPKEQSIDHSTENTKTSETEKKKPPQQVSTTRNRNIALLSDKSPESFKTLGDLYPHGFHIPQLTGFPPVAKEVSDKFRELSSALTALQDRAAAQARELQAVQMAQEKEEKLIALQATYSELEEKARLSFLLNRVNQDAQRTLLQSEQFSPNYS